MLEGQVLLALTCFVGLSHEQVTADLDGLRYSFLDVPTNYVKARGKCIEGGYGVMAEIHSQEEADFIKTKAASVPGTEFFIGINNGQWFSGTNMDYTDWCSAGEVTSGSVVLDPTNNYCWKEATVEEAGVICQRRSERIATVADFLPVAALDECYLFSRVTIFPLSDVYGLHSVAGRMCNDIGANLIGVSSEEENLRVVGMANCYFAREVEVQEEDLAFIINVGDGYDNFAEGQEPGSCTLMSGASGLWSSRSLDECLGAADSAIDDFKAHVICKMSSACPGSWTSVLRHDLRNGQFFISEEDVASKNPDDAFEADLFSRLNTLDALRTPDAKYHLRLVYPELDGSVNEWLQDSNPFKEQKISGFHKIKIDLDITEEVIGQIPSHQLSARESSSYEEDIRSPPSYAIDDVISDDQFWYSNENVFSWLQVDMRDTRTIVSAIVYHRKDDDYGLFESVEMRVGDSDASGLPEAQLLVNEVCGHLSSVDGHANFFEYVCDAPLSGRFVTLQKTAAEDTPRWNVDEVKIFEVAKFRGLGKDINGGVGITPAAMDWDPSGEHWEFSVGAFEKFQKGLLGPTDKAVTHVELLAHTFKRGDCYEREVVYEGLDVSAAPQAVAESIEECQRRCQSSAECKVFSFISGSDLCTLKTGYGTRTELADAVSGPKYCGAPRYDQKPACGFPAMADPSSFLKTPTAIACPYDVLVYECDVGGLNELEGQPGVSTVNGECSMEGIFVYPETWPVCISSLTCPLPRSVDNGEVVCDDVQLPEGATCRLVCNSGYLPDSVFETTCSFGEGAFYWSKPLEEMTCVTQVGVVVGGIKPDLGYTDGVEVFSPSQECHSFQVPDYPLKIMGAVPGVVDGLGVVCGGAEEIHGGCSKTSLGAFYCNYNAEKVTTTGGSEWTTGPKTKDCYFYNDYSNTWSKAVELQFARVYASSANLPDGTMIIAGGIGKSGILKTAEIVGRNQDGSWYSRRVPQLMPRGVFGHCSLVDPEGYVYFIGGFDGTDYTGEVVRFDLEAQSWQLMPYKLREPRFDHSCFLVNLEDDKPAFVAVGGWNENGFINTTEIMELELLYWVSKGETDSGLKLEDMSADDAHLRRSGAGFVDGGRPMVVGGTVCGKAEGEVPQCERLKSAVKMDLDEWVTTEKEMMLARSSFTILSLPITRVCH